MTDICTDSTNCKRCRTDPKWRGDMRHAGIPLGLGVSPPPPEPKIMTAEFAPCGVPLIGTNCQKSAMEREIESLRASLTRETMRADLAEAALPGLIFSKRKALVEHCAKIAEACELFNGDHLKNSDPRVTIAETIRQHGLSRATSAEGK